jgi:zinc transport system substrate-binding protein
LRIVLATALVLLAAACGSSSGSGGGTQVVAAFYPLAYAAQQIGGSSVHVRNLTPSGAEPHDIELTPRDVADLQRADVVLYLSHDFQPAVQKAVADARGRRIDVLGGIPLVSGVGDEAGKTDPHVWLDPVLYERIVTRIGAVLGHPAAARALAAKVHRLDLDYRTGLAHCARRDFVSSHAAFGYLAARYGLHQVPITGIDPESEPTPQKLASLARLVKRLHIDTVFFERLVSPKLAQTVAREAGAKTAVLDPIEGLTPGEAKAGATYLSVMRENLAQLRRVLGCS